MSSWDLSSEVEIDLMARSIENLAALSVSSYISLDARLGWRPNANWEFALVG